MIIQNRVFVTFAERNLFSTVSFFKLNRYALLNSLIHERCFSSVEDSVGFCSNDCVSLLQLLGDTKNVRRGKSIHSFCVKTGFDKDVFVENNLMRFYGLCGDLVSARFVFDEMRAPNVVSWTSIVSAYVNDGQYENGLKMFCLMFRSGLKTNEFGFSVALKACRALKDYVMGMLIHGQIVKCGFELCYYCNASVLGFYAEHVDIRVARRLFDATPSWVRSEAAWNTLLNGYVENSDVEEAVGLFKQMMLRNVSPNCFTFSTLVKLCADVLDFSLARLFHGQILKVGCDAHIVVGGALVDAYAKLGFLDDACGVFGDLKAKDNLVWSTLLAGFNQTGMSERGLRFYLRFLSEGNKPDVFMYGTVTSLCLRVESVHVGIQVHCSSIKDGFEMDSFLGSALIDMYGSHGMVSDSYQCFLEVEQKNEICFGSIINVFLLHLYEEKAIELFSEMMKYDLVPSHSTVSCALRACGNIRMPKEGRSVHCYIIKNFPHVDSNLGTRNAFIEMYAKLRNADSMRNVFSSMKTRNEFSWTALISGCSDLGLFEEALQMFKDMLYSSESAKPSEFTVLAVIQACTKTLALEMGKQSHGYATKVGFDCNPFVQSALISMYATSRHEIQNASLVFSCTEGPDLVSWSTMVMAWAQNGYKKKALELFSEFQKALNFGLDESILTSCFSACSGLAALEVGKSFHGYSVRAGFSPHLHVASSIIDMYSKCGNIKDARKFFDEIGNHNLVCWTAMMSGYAYNGFGKKAVELFMEMERAGMKPDGVTFIGILTACSHAGLINEGWEFFRSMKDDYGLEASINHYTCMVDLLGRAEQVDKAEDFINKAPFDPKSKSVLWKTLLGACNKFGNFEFGRRIGQIVLGLEPNEPSNYVLLSNIYASADMWDTSMEMRNKMRVRHANKKPGSSWIQVEN